MGYEAFVPLPAALSLSELGANFGSAGYLKKVCLTCEKARHVQFHGQVRSAHYDASQKEYQRMRRNGNPNIAVPTASSASKPGNILARRLVSAGNAERQSLRERLENIPSPKKSCLAASHTQNSHSKNFEGYYWRTSSTRLLNAAPELPMKLIPLWDGTTLKAIVMEANSLYKNLNLGDPSFVVPHIWLRDICPCEKCVHPETLQRMVDIFDLPKDAYRIKHCSVFGLHVYITWNDGHESCINFNELPKLSGFGNWYGRAGFKKHFVPFTNSVAEAPPTVQYEDVMKTDEGLADWLAQIRHKGFTFVEKVPIDPGATKSLLERIAFVRQTHYGGFWDFTADLSSKDTAYTQEALPLHTDTTYFSDPAGLQLFHLLSHTDGEGGETILVDGLRAAYHIKSQDKFAYKTLKSTGIYAHASGNIDSSIQPCTAYPVINEDRSRRIIQIRWNPADRAGIGVAIDKIGDWYKAAKLWNDWIKQESNQYRFQLKPGTALIFDNWRVLHARTAFTGKRRMCGGYINRDDFVSRYKMMNWGRWQTLKALGLNPSLNPEDGDRDKESD